MRRSHGQSLYTVCKWSLGRRASLHHGVLTRLRGSPIFVPVKKLEEIVTWRKWMPFRFCQKIKPPSTLMKFREAHGEPGPNCTGPGPKSVLPWNYLRYLGIISELYWRARSLISLESAWYGAFFTLGYKTCDAQGEKETY